MSKLDQRSELSLYLFVIMIVCVATYFLGSGEISAAALNLGTEVAGIGLTIFLVDRLLSERDKSLLIPRQAAIYEDVRLFTSTSLTFWHSLYFSSVPSAQPSSMADIISPHGLQLIGRYLNLDADSSTIPPQQWWTRFPQEIAAQQLLADKILDRHSWALEPKVLRAVHQANYNLGIFTHIPAMRNLCVRINMPLPSNLGCYCNFPPEYCHAMNELAVWCLAEYEKLVAAGVAGIFPISYELIFPPSGHVPRYMIADDVYREQHERYARWQASQQPT